MSEEINLRIPKDTFNRILELSEFFKQNKTEIINDILSSTSLVTESLINLAKECKFPVRFGMLVSRLLLVGSTVTRQLFDEVLEILGAKGLYAIEGLNLDVQENCLQVSFDSHCDLQVDIFEVTLKPGLKELAAMAILEARNISEEAADRLKEIVRNVEDEIELPEEFYDLEDYEIEVEDDLPDSLYLTVNCYADSVIFFPKIPRISQLIQQILQKAGIERVETNSSIHLTFR